MTSYSDLVNLNAKIEAKGAYVGILLEKVLNAYTKSIGEFIIGVLEIQYLATEVNNLISIFIQNARSLPTFKVPQQYTTYICYIQDIIHKCERLLSNPITNPELMLLVPEKMLERAQQTMYNLLPPVPSDYRHGEMGRPLEHFAACNNSLYNNDYANLASYARKAEDDIQTLPNVLESLSAQRDAETIARDNARIAAERAQADVLRQRIEEYRNEQERLATLQDAQARIIAERMEHANLNSNNNSSNPFGAVGGQRSSLESLALERLGFLGALAIALRTPAAEARAEARRISNARGRPATDTADDAAHDKMRAARIAAAGVSDEESKKDDMVYNHEKKPFFVDEEFTKSKSAKLNILKKLIGRMNGTEPISDDELTKEQIRAGETHETINVKEEMNKIVPNLGNKVVFALEKTHELINVGPWAHAPQQDIQTWTDHNKEIYKILTEDMIENQDQLSKDKDVYFKVPVECLMKAGRFLVFTPATPMGGQHKIARKQNFTKKQSKKHNITKNKKNRKK